jgi:chromosome segregation ATPase
MDKKLKKTLFGFKPEEVMNEIGRIDHEYQEKIAALMTEIETATMELRKSEEKRSELENRLNNYIEREHQIAEVMMTAQMNSQKIEEQAREKAHAMLEHSEEELKRKNQELEFLRLKVARFKEEFRDTLDRYKFSLDSITEPDGGAFAPTLIVNDKIKSKAATEDISS